MVDTNLSIPKTSYLNEKVLDVHFNHLAQPSQVKES